MKTKGSTSRKRRDTTQMKAAIRIVKRVFRRAGKDAAGTPHPRKRIDPAAARAMAEAPQERLGVSPSPTSGGGWLAVVRDEHGLQRLGVFRTKPDATSAFHTVTAQRLVEMIAREIDALPFRGERTLSHILARRALSMESRTNIGFCRPRRKPPR